MNTSRAAASDRTAAIRWAKWKRRLHFVAARLHTGWVRLRDVLIFVLGAPYSVMVFFLGVVLGVGINLLTMVLGEPGKSPVAPGILNWATGQYPLELIWVTFGAFGAFLISWYCRNVRRRKEKLSEHARVYSPSQSLPFESFGFVPAAPDDLPPGGTERSFRGKYTNRVLVEFDRAIEAAEDFEPEFTETDLAGWIRGQRGFLIVGAMRSGKTLTLLHILRELIGHTVICPHSTAAPPDEWALRALTGQRVVVFLDDIATFMSANYALGDLISRVTRATGRQCIVVGTCRDGSDYESLLFTPGNHVVRFCEGLPRLRLRLITGSQKDMLNRVYERNVPSKDLPLYVHPGDFAIADWAVMRSRFNGLRESDKDTLRALKLLDSGGLSPSRPLVQALLGTVFQRAVEPPALDETLRTLRKQDFLLFSQSNDTVRPHFGHLVRVVHYSESFESEDAHWSEVAQALHTLGDATPLIKLGNVLSRRYLHKLALETLELASSLDPDNAYVQFLRGRSFMRARRNVDALDALDAALKLDDSFVRAWYWRGITLGRLGRNRLDEAVQSFEKARSLRPGDQRSTTGLAVALARLGRKDESLELYKQALTSANNPVFLLLNAGLTLATDGAFDEALGFFKRAIELRPDNADAHLYCGISMARRDLELGRAGTDAMKHFERAIALRPDFAEAFCNRGIAESRNDDFKAAIQDFDEAIRLKPAYTQAYYNRGIAHSRNDMIEKAFQDFDKALELRPDFAEAYFNRGRTKARIGEFRAAIPDFDEAIDLRPGYFDAYWNRGIALANDDQCVAGLASVDTAVAIDDGNADAHFARGYVLTRFKGFDRARLEAARIAYEQAILLRPGFPEAHRELGFVLGQLLRDEEALQAFNKALELREDFPEALFGKARSLCFLAKNCPDPQERAGMHAEAAKLLHQAITLDERIIKLIQRDKSAFGDLRKSGTHWEELDWLIWSSKTRVRPTSQYGGRDNPG